MGDEILYINNNPNNLKPFNSVIKSRFSIHFAQGFGQANQILKQKSIKAILLEHNLPFETNLEFINETHTRYPELTIIVLTEEYEEDLFQKLFPGGYVTYIAKNSWSEEKILELLKQVVKSCNLLINQRELKEKIRKKNKSLKSKKKQLNQISEALKKVNRFYTSAKLPSRRY